MKNLEQEYVSMQVENDTKIASLQLQITDSEDQIASLQDKVNDLLSSKSRGNTTWSIKEEELCEEDCGQQVPQESYKLDSSVILDDRSVKSTKSVTKRKEADTLEFERWPTVAKFRAWRLAFRREVSNKSARPKEALKWISEVDHAKCLEELMTSCSINDPDIEDFETLDGKISTALLKICHGLFQKKVLFEDEKFQKKHDVTLTGRQIAWMIYHHFKISETELQALDETDLMSLTLQRDNLRAFDQAWDEILLNIEEEPKEKMLELLYRTQLEQSSEIQNALALYEQDIVQRGESRSYVKLKTIVANFLDKKQRNLHRQNLLNHRSKSVGAAASIPNEARKQGDCYQWVKKGKCSRGDDCGFKHDDAKKGDDRRPTPKAKPKAKAARGRSQDRKESRPIPTRGVSPSGQPDKPPCRQYLSGECPRGQSCNYWHPPDCFHFKKGNCSKGTSCNFRHVQAQANVAAKP